MWSLFFGPSARELADRLLAAGPAQVGEILGGASRRTAEDALDRALADLFLEDLPPRLDLLEALAERNPVRAFGRIDRAWDQSRHDLVQRLAQGVLKRQPGHVGAAEWLIRSLLAQGETRRAAALLERASRTEPTFQILRAEILVQQDRADEAGPMLTEICDRAWRMLSSGLMSPDDHNFWRSIFERANRLREGLLQQVAGRDAVLKDAAARGQLMANSGVNHTLVGQSAMADSGRIADTIDLQPLAAARAAARGADDPRSRARLGECALREGDLAGAERIFRDLVREAPGFFPGQLGLGAVLLAGETRSLQARLPDLDLEPRWRAVVADWDALGPEERQVVACSAAGLGAALPGLLAAGARIHLLPIDVRPVDRPEFAELEGVVAPDGRRYAGIGGLASGRGVAVARIEGLRLVRHHWVFAHELAHLAFWGLPEELQASFVALFERARAVEWAWSQYQQSNVDEFFAVSYEDLLLERYGGKAAPPDGSGLWAEVKAWFDGAAR